MSRERITPKYVTITGVILLDKSLTDKQKILVALIDTLSNARGYCFADNSYISEILDCDKDTVSRNLSELRKSGHITLEVITENGAFKERRIMVEENLGINVIIGEENSELDTKTPTHKKGYPPTRKKVGIVNDNSFNKEIYKESFLRFWKLYPKKINKDKCDKMWNKLKQDDIDKIFETLPNFLYGIKDIKFIPHPKKYLTQKRWNDKTDKIVQPVGKVVDHAEYSGVPVPKTAGL